MKAQTDYFRVSSNAQDRIKLPRVFWAGLKSIDLTPGAIPSPEQLAAHCLRRESLVTPAQSFSIWPAIRELCNDPTADWKFMSQVDRPVSPDLTRRLHARTYREALVQVSALCRGGGGGLRY